jgi:hypothetical protein
MMASELEVGISQMVHPLPPAILHQLKVIYSGLVVTDWAFLSAIRTSVSSNNSCNRREDESHWLNTHIDFRKIHQILIIGYEKLRTVMYLLPSNTRAAVIDRIPISKDLAYCRRGLISGALG